MARDNNYAERTKSERGNDGHCQENRKGGNGSAGAFMQEDEPATHQTPECNLSATFGQIQLDTGDLTNAIQAMVQK
jgi:hypothetical protein